MSGLKWWRASGLLCALCLFGCPTEPSAPPSAEVADAISKADTSAPAPFAAPVLKHRPSPLWPAPPGGAVWARLHPERSSGLMMAVAAHGKDALVVSADGEVFRVSEAGVWSKLGPVWGSALIDVASARVGDKRHMGILDAQGRIHVSSDGGQTWRQLRGRPEGFEGEGLVMWSRREAPYQALAMRGVGDKLFIAACGKATHALTSRDGGASWKADQIEGLQDLYTCTIGPKGTVVVAGERGKAYRLDPDQSAWSHIPLSGKPHAQAVAIDPDALDSFVFGGQGGLLRVGEKRGNTWVMLDRPSGNIAGLALVDSKTWLAVSDEGELWRSKDRGAGWEVLRASDGRALSGIAVAEGGRYFAVGPELLLSGLVGESAVEVLKSERTLGALEVFGQGRALAIGAGGEMLKAQDGAVERVDLGSLFKEGGQRPDLTAVDFAGGRFGWVTTRRGEVLITRDGARTWGIEDPDEKGQRALFSVAALDPLNVFAGGENGVLIATGDRGETWRAVEMPDKVGSGAGFKPGVMSLGMRRMDKGAQIVAGLDGGSLLVGKVGRRELGAVSLAGLGGIADISSVDGRVWVMDTSGVILRRDEAEGPWRLLAVPGGLAFSAGAFDEAGRGVVMAVGGLMARTMDGGVRWWLVEHTHTKVLHGIAHLGEGVFVAVGHGGAVLRSEDGGAGWSPVTSGVGKTLRAVTRTGGVAVAVGLGGSAIQSADGGRSWSPWKDAPQDLGGTHLTAVEVGPDGVVGLGGIGACWVRESGTWQRLKVPEGERLGEIKSVEVGPGGALFVVEATGVLRRRAAGGAVLEKLGWMPKGGETARFKDVSVSSWETLEGWVSLEEGIFSFDGSGELTPWGAVRASQAAALAFVEGAGRRWLLGPGGLWAQNRGGDWVQTLPAFALAPSDLGFATREVGFAVGIGGAIYRTEDGGVVWLTEGSTTRTELKAVEASRDGAVWAVGRAGAVLRRPRK